ncbi:MAG: hypothetical protein R2748_05505 [Bryobacterales bacterium]
MDLASPQANRFLAFYLLCLALLHAALYWVAAGGGPGRGPFTTSNPA